tara:strand:- start:90568 stop:91293 length:726 start_codon:yes stop_codon:yes gene_type:complete
MLYTVTNSGLQNGRPTAIGANTISIAFAATHVFTLANFTTETTPAYSDPEDDALSYIKILSLPATGTLKIDGVDAILGDQVSSGQISTGNLTYVSAGAGDFTFEFDAADVGSNSLSGLSTGIITMSVATAINLPPSAVGDNTLAAAYGDSITFTVANFTSETTPSYADPEGDAASLVKILTLPADGTLVFNGIDVIVNQEMTVSEIASGYLVYNPDLAITILQSLTFDFSVADAGSGTHTT